MSQSTRTLALAACAVAAGMLVSACGGGGDASAPATATQSFGWAVDGYLSGATVVCDGNGNGVADAGEVSVTTASDRHRAIASRSAVRSRSQR